MSEKVVYLAFKSDELVADARDLLACKSCRNKTFTVVYDGDESFPVLQCPACGNHLNRIGFAEL